MRARPTNAHGDQGVVECGAEVGRVEIAGFGEQHVERREDDPAHDVKAHDEHKNEPDGRGRGVHEGRSTEA